MRRMTQSTITARIFGICQDRQAVAVVVNARRLTALLRLWAKRTMCRYRREHHAFHALFSASPASAEIFSCQGRVGHAVALDRLALVEVVASGRC